MNYFKKDKCDFCKKQRIIFLYYVLTKNICLDCFYELYEKYTDKNFFEKDREEFLKKEKESYIEDCFFIFFIFLISLGIIFIFIKFG